jgi:hypothetical protein
MEIIIGIVIGIIVAMGVGYWSVKKNEVLLPIGEEVDAVAEWKTLVYPVRQQLSNALFDCEQELKQCKQQLLRCWENQLDLIAGVGNVSHIEVKGKPLFFEYNNTLNGERFFYYDRDLSPSMTLEERLEIKTLLEQYQTRIELLQTQQQLFESLIESHQQNLETIENPEKINLTTAKLEKHQQYLHQQNTVNEVEERAIYNEILLEQIAEEVQYQIDMVEQYNDLNANYTEDAPLSKDKIDFRTKIEAIITRVEDKHPKR